MIARCLVDCTEWEFVSQNVIRLCVPFSYFYCFSHLSIYLPLPSIISLKYFNMVLLDVSSNDFLQKHDFDHFDLILFQRFSCKISFWLCIPFAGSHHKYEQFTSGLFSYHTSAFWLSVSLPFSIRSMMLMRRLGRLWIFFRIFIKDFSKQPKISHNFVKHFSKSLEFRCFQYTLIGTSPIFFSTLPTH